MRKFALPALLLVTFFTLLVVVFTHTTSVHAVATHIVISEIQEAGATAGDEFVELYNPTGNDVDLSGWRLRRETLHGATTSASLVSSISGTIKSHGYFLIGSQAYTGETPLDQMFTSSSSAITANNTILLFQKTGTNPVDKVGMGQAEDNEATDASDPVAKKSIERKANTDSTAESMTTGADEFAGNGQDTDNNTADFILRDTPEPQNSSSPTEPAATPTPTNSPTPTASPIPTDTPAPTDTPIPTTTPTPTPTATPTVTPSPVPTNTPAPTATPSPTLTGFPTPTPTSAPFPIIPTFRLFCTSETRSIHILSFTFSFSIPSCSLIRG